MKRFYLLLTLFFTQYSFTQSQQEVFLSGIKTHIEYLASDKLEGRRAGEKGNNDAAEYIATLFRKYKLEPLDEMKSFYQPFDFVSGVKVAEGTSSFATTPTGTIQYQLDSSFRPLGFSADTSVSGELVFAGYGISAPQLNYDDYATLDVKDKIVLVLRYSPPTDSTNQREFQRLSALYKKAQVAKDKGARGIIFVTGPLDDEVPKLLRLTYRNDEGTTTIAAISIKWNVADSLFHIEKKSIRDVQKEINTSKQPVSFAFKNVTLNITTRLKKQKAQTQNVVGLLKGSDESLKEEYIVIGAHYDHLGFGGEGSGSTKPDSIAIHNGADDNASGTAGLLELAKVFSERKEKPKRSIIFIGFSAEESGLLGSAYYTNHPLVPLEKTVAMFNMDMIGRLKNNELVVYGTGTSPSFDSLVDVWNRDSLFTLKKTKDGFGPSDQTSFYVKDIPVLFFFTNLHDDYHNPGDDWEKVNFEGEAKVLNYIYNISNSLLSYETKPTFTRVASSGSEMMSGDRRGARASLGVVPAFGEEDVKGAKISGVRPGTAAEKAGLQKDDIIIRFAGKEVANLMDLTNHLGDFKPGDEVEIVVLRNKEEVKLKAVLGTRTN
ncbi:MAG: M20/M25/M40 family metallo-hydrolase [Ignavibacteriales bacterium]|nr:M20/M25/M40 family metallo-hydrolase [Ignavibacteriales bacterium]